MNRLLSLPALKDGASRRFGEAERDRAERVSVARGYRCYPAIQFHDGEVLTGLAPLFQALAGKEPWVILDILLAPDPALNGRTPIQALRDRDEQALRRHIARAVGDRFA